MRSDLKHIITDGIFANPQFQSAVFSGIERALFENEWKKITIKPVMLKDGLQYQFNYYDNLKSITKNYHAANAATEINAILTLGFKSIYLRDEDSGTQIQITKKGKLLVKKHKNLPATKTDLSHDKAKVKIIQATPENAYFKILGISDEAGKTKPSMQGKFRQINEFVKILDKLQDWNDWPRNLSIVDCGAGNAYLTFAAFDYFRNIRNKNVTVTGIDINAELVENNRARAAQLNWNGLKFEISNIIGFVPDIAPTMTLALHACDTATDEALLKAITWKSDFILAAPCCHHDLQRRLKKASVPEEFAGVVKHAILRERQGDLLTDAFRGLILEIMGYRTDIIQFVSTEHTAKNILIRATKTSDAPVGDSVAAYHALKAFWKVTPLLEELLADNPEFIKRLS